MANLNSSSPRTQRVIISPRARRLLLQSGLDPRSLQGSGPGGRVVVADIPVASQISAAPEVGSGISTMRRAIAEKTALSFATIPHFYLRVEADVTALMDIRKRLVPVVEHEVGAKLTVTDFLLRGMARAMAKFPYANAIWQNNSIVKLPLTDLGVVVGLTDGLLIPILRNVNQLTLAQLAKQRSDLVAAGRAGKLAVEVMQGGAMSLSNLGTSPVDEFAPVIAPSQSSMLAVGRAMPRPFVVDGKLAARTTLRLCLAVDHRVMDGGPAAEILGLIVHLIEHPNELI